MKNADSSDQYDQFDGYTAPVEETTQEEEPVREV